MSCISDGRPLRARVCVPRQSCHQFESCDHSRSTMDVAFRRVKPGEEIPPRPKELDAWAADTATGTMAGMVYGVMRARAAEARAFDPELADIVRRRNLWMRSVHEATMGGVRFGSFVAVFSAVQLGSQSYRGDIRDMWNTVAAGAITAGATGLALPGGIAMRLQGLALGLVVGGGLCLPLGYLLQELEKHALPISIRASKENAVDKGGKQGGRDHIADVIAIVESELQSTPDIKSNSKRWFPWFRGG